MSGLDMGTNDYRNGLHGRRVLVATPPAQLNAASVAQIMKDVDVARSKNAQEASFLHKFYKGKQPILDRVKKIRPEIDNRIVENRAMEIVQFKLGYEFSHPVIYTNIGEGETTRIDLLNTYARLDGQDYKNIEMAEWMYAAGTSYRICLPNPRKGKDFAPYYTDVLDPRNAFVVYANEVGRRKLLAGTCVKRTVIDQNGLEVEQTVYGIYTDTRYYEWIFNGTVDFTAIEPTERPNGIGAIPIFEYPLNPNRLGYVEACLLLYNAINSVTSSRVDDIEQIVQSLLLFFNCDFEDDPDTGEKKAPKSGDAIVLKTTVAGVNADAKFISPNLNQSGTQVIKEDILNAIYEICGVPDRKTRGNGGGDTGQAVVLRDGWGAAEARAKSTEKAFRKSEMEYLLCALNICRSTVDSEIGDISLRDIDVKFTRNRNDNMLVKAETLGLLLQNGVSPEDSYEVCELFSDPTATWLKSKAYQDELTRKQEELARQAEKEAEQMMNATVSATRASNEDDKNSAGGGADANIQN